MDDEKDWGPKRFRFINAWTLHLSFPHSWTRFGMNLELLEEQVFGNLLTKLKKAEKELVELDILAEDRHLVEVERFRRREVRGEVWKLSRMVEWLWQQKSRVNWTINGDKNIKVVFGRAF
ncbi:hypothetical protein ACSBR1_031181 [Camellia fascicularis]